MRRLATAFLITAGLLGGCSVAPPQAISGADALGVRLSTMEELVDWIDETAGDCAEVTTREVGELRDFVGADMAARLAPFVAEWATCRVSTDFPMVGLVLFSGDQQRKFQESWSAAMAAGEVADGPTFAFGNGFAVSQGYLGTAKLGLFYFRCDYLDPKVHQVAADVDGCVFANPEHAAH